MTDQHMEMEGNSMKARRFIAFIGFALLLLSQILIASQPVNDAVVFPPYTGLAVAGAVLFLIGLTVRPTALLQKLSDHALLRDGAFWHLFAITLSVLAAYGATLPQRNYIPVMSIWFMGAIGYLFVFADGGVSLETLKEKIRKNHTEILLVLVIVIVAVTVRFYNLGQVPRVLDGDEGLVGLAAQSTAEGRLTNPFALWENFGALYLHAINIALRSFGATSNALRLMPAIGGVERHSGGDPFFSLFDGAGHYRSCIHLYGARPHFLSDVVQNGSASRSRVLGRLPGRDPAGSDLHIAKHE